MVQIRCPRCQTIIELVTGTTPVCPSCGFTGPPPEVPPEMLPVAAPPAPREPEPRPSEPAPPPAPPTAYHASPGLVAGKPRRFWICLLLGIVTFGVYFWVWNYKAFRELDQEHGERHDATLFWLSLGSGVLSIAIILLSIVPILQAFLAQEGPPDFAAVLRIFVLALAVAFTGLILRLVYLWKEVSKVERHRTRHGLGPGVSPVLFIVLILLGSATGNLTTIIGYYMLTKSINEVWREAYRKRGIPWPLPA